MKIVSKLLLALAAMTATASFAATQPAGCTWTNVSVQSSYSGAIVTDACMLNGTAIATRTRKYSQYNPMQCSISVISPYSYTGSCDSAQIVKPVTLTCNSGAKIIAQTSPTGMTPSYSDISNFCGGSQCSYTARPLDNYSYPRLEFTCN